MATRQSGRASIAPTGIVNRDVPAFQRGGTGDGFIGEPEQTVSQDIVGGIAGETAAALGLFMKVRDCAI